MEPAWEIDWEQVPCPLCGSPRWSSYLKGREWLFDLPGEFQLVRCRDCRHVFLNPRPTPESIHHYYPRAYGPYHLIEPSESTVETATRTPSADAHPPWYLSRGVRAIPGLRRLYYWLSETYAEVIPEVEGPSKRALELGCADGRFLMRLQQSGWEVQGVEFAEEPAQRALARGLPVHVGRLEPGLLPARSFDAVFAWMVIEHLHDPLATLREVRRIAKDTAWLVLSVPNFGCWEPKVFGRYWYSLELPRHLHHFTTRSLRRMLEQCGFRMVRVIHQRNLLNLVGSIGLWWRAWFPRSRLAARLIAYPDHPGFWSQLAMAPWAILLAWMRQGGRLTVIARAQAV